MISGTAVMTNHRVNSDQKWVVFTGLVVLNIMDVATTMLVLSRGGVEGNPFIRPLTGVVWQVSLLKAVVLAMIGVFLARSHQSRIGELALAATTGWYLAVVMWNLSVLAAV